MTIIMNEEEEKLVFFCRFCTGYNIIKCKECDYQDYCQKETIKNYSSIKEYNELNKIK